MREKQTTLGIRLSRYTDAHRVRRAVGLMAWLAFGWTLTVTNPLCAQSLTWLGTLGGNLSDAYGVSADGSVVVGWSYNASAQSRAFRWQNGVMQDLGTLGGTGTRAESRAFGVSADGSVVVGWSFNAAGRHHAFRWTVAAGMRDLGTLGGSTSDAWAVSADGSVVVGWSRDAAGQLRAFRWTSGTGMQSLGTLGGSESRAFGVSRNGSVVVGWSLNHLGERWAFVWRNPAQGMQGLNPLAVCCGEAYGVSDDGLVIAGRAHSAVTEQWHACLWIWNGSDYSPVDLGVLVGESQAFACTNNLTAVGFTRNSAWHPRAFRWTPSAGMIDLTAAYSSLLSLGSYLEVAYDITPDGRFIVGRGYNAATGRQEAYLLDTLCIGHNGDVDANGCIDDADLLGVLFAFGSTGEILGRADVNCDGTIDDADLLQVLFNFGSGC